MSAPTKTTAAAPAIIRWKDLEPSWHLARQEPGYMRWMIQWVGGPEGYYNCSPGQAVISEDAVVGFMHIPQNNRQRGLHYHSITEIYVILRGEVLGWDGHGEEHRAGPLDCIYIPAGVPHGVRTYGDEPVDLIWLHDALEKKGTTVYWDPSLPNPQDESKETIKIVSYKDLEPNWDDAQKLPPGQMHSNRSYVSGVKGSKNFNPGKAVPNNKAALGLTVIPEGHKQIITGRANAETCVIVSGKAVVNIGNGNEELGRLDAVYVPAGVSRTLRNHGTEPTYIVWTHEKPSLGETAAAAESTVSADANGNGTVENGAATTTNGH
ncbi:hypothetical protein A1O3_02946 [Capronia epimyces CBS 606.96]|uniref:Cupin type-2 domain-containing protein n=1 Tax=Capronia epimyces CBS 606.96 TaxID=1182542 RepID=W9Z5X5_9EURO|nr:uncharacterized protein A1O3_02946 [Capronia epimyces CBS 606.96]EXJ89879.1 hypothetical protein A1O3_02946 [Capronia epimyces CBS 606.96]